MDGILNLLQSVSELGEDDLSKVLKTFQEHQSFRLTGASSINSNLSFITLLLNSPSTRESGLLLLDSYLPQCTLDVLEEKGSTWFTLCIKTCAQKSPVTAIPRAYAVICTLLSKSLEIPEMQKAIASNFLSKIIESTADIPETAQFAALKCLELCMKEFSSSCGFHKTALEKFCLKFVNSSDDQLVEQAAKCSLMLQQIRGGGNQRILHKNAWSVYQTQLIRCIHNTYDLLFANISETFEYKENVEEGSASLKIPEDSSIVEPVGRAISLFTRFKNLCKYLEIALLHPYPVAKGVQPLKIFTLITRGLAINCTIISKNSILDNIAIGSFIPDLHICLYKLMNSLIVILRGNLLLQSRVICDAVEQTLKWTASGKANGTVRPYRNLRITAYRTLSLWCKTVKYASGVEKISESLIVQILHDITPYETEVKLKILKGASNLSKKAKKRLLKAQNDETNLAQSYAVGGTNTENTKQLFSDEGNQELCENALKCLNDTLVAANCFIKPVLHKVIQENIVSICLTIASTSNLKSTLYEYANCRKCLYECLATLIVSAHHLCPPPTQYATTILSITGTTDANSDVRDIAMNKLRIIEKILHPHKETFYFSTDANSYLDAVNVENIANIAALAQFTQNKINVLEEPREEEMIIDNPIEEVQQEQTPKQNGVHITIVPENNEQKSIVIENDLDEEKAAAVPDNIINLDKDDENEDVYVVSDDNGENSEESLVFFNVDDDDVNLAPPPVVAEAKPTTYELSPQKKMKLVDKSVNGGEKTADDMVEEMMSTFIDEINENLL